ncbi:lauroyl acyltransferase [Magnetospira sp. QH-2]|uniref:LpxL/LpxP family acyltransferase n=1 Tax=Magnetospira sp. (strain QH-2) TaxID=1288970 RepID=UPI0003E81079|nr:lauroyl acyltransferase [Magnetospira sp. QH-2]CCQ74889.1 putative lipid A biosynthesis lauroyl acyltransferase [Magnetospira sp. QH-2]
MSLKTHFVQPLEAVVVWLLWHGLRWIPVDISSAVLGRLAAWLGPKLPVTRRARNNIGAAFPQMSENEREATLREMWENLGRTVAEHPHLDRLRIFGPEADGRIEVVGSENLDLMRDDSREGLFFSGHLANWEVISIVAAQRGIVIDVVYRAANNPHMDWLYQKGRAPIGGQLIPKGPKGARILLKALRDGRHVGMLVDQKMNDGIAVPFFGRDAMTAPALAELALKYNCPVIPSRTERIGGARFRCTFFPPMEINHTGNRSADVAEFMTRVNALLESWIRERPGQWLWLHNRWPKN